MASQRSARAQVPRWDDGDLLALTAARAVFDGSSQRAVRRGPGGELEPLRFDVPGAEVARVLSSHALLTLIDPSWEFLGLEGAERAQLTRRFRLMRAAALGRVSVAAQVRDALAGAGIEALFLKGIVQSQVVWGRPNARGIGDIDVHVAETDLPAAIEALRGIGAHPQSQVADLRPRPSDRRMHHAITCQRGEVEVDVHYRLDENPDVHTTPFSELLADSQLLVVGGEEFRTLSDVEMLLFIASHGGRDVWPKWGAVLDFAKLRQRVAGESPDAERAISTRAAAAGLGHRYEIAVGLAGVIDPDAPAPTGEALRVARAIIARHARGAPADVDALRRQGPAKYALRARSVGGAGAWGWEALRFLWLEDAPGRSADDGTTEVVRDGLVRAGTLARNAVRTYGHSAADVVRPLLERGSPPELAPRAELADLLDAAAAWEASLRAGTAGDGTAPGTSVRQGASAEASLRGREASEGIAVPGAARERVAREAVQALGMNELGAFAYLDAALRADTVGSEEYAVIPAVAPLLAAYVPEHPFAGIIAGIRRRERVQSQTAAGVADAVVSALAARGVASTVLGDVGAVRALYGGEHGDRMVRGALVVVPRGTDAELIQAALADAAATSGEVLTSFGKGLRAPAEPADGAGAPAGTSTGHGSTGPAFGLLRQVLPARRAVRRLGAVVEVREDSLSAAFDFAAARAALRGALESGGATLAAGGVPAVGGGAVATPTVALFESIVGASLGAPRSRWYGDAVAARARGVEIDWAGLLALAEASGWLVPVAEALAVLRDRGWDVPVVSPPREALIDRLYRTEHAARRSGAGAVALRTALGARVAARSTRRHRSPVASARPPG